MKSIISGMLISILLFVWGCSGPGAIEPSIVPQSAASLLSLIILPAPRMESDVSLEEALLNRRSVREYSSQPLELTGVSQLLWAAQGLTSEQGGRSAPSAGGLYPLEIFLVVGNIAGLEAGVYRYIPEGHKIGLIKTGDLRTELAAAALAQSWVKDAAADIIIAAVYERTTRKYGERGIRYVHLEAGHAAQNICLEAVALDLGAVTVGDFDDNRVNYLLGLADDMTSLYIIPIGNMP